MRRFRREAPMHNIPAVLARNLYPRHMQGIELTTARYKSIHWTNTSQSVPQGFQAPGERVSIGKGLLTQTASPKISRILSHIRQNTVKPWVSVVSSFREFKLKDHTEFHYREVSETTSLIQDNVNININPGFIKPAAGHTESDLQDSTCQQPPLARRLAYPPS